jgi:uncharacterized DUF497 family protein
MPETRRFHPRNRRGPWPDPAIEPDSFAAEERLRAIGTTSGGRYVFLVFTLRARGRATFLRPISARYMQLREAGHYEEEKDSDV